VIYDWLGDTHPKQYIVCWDLIPTMTTISDLAYWNGWWKNEESLHNDKNIIDWRSSNFKWEPRLEKTIENEEVVYVLRGPRRVGKTTLVKLRIQELLEQGVDPHNIFYYPCDALESPTQLRSVIDEYLSDVREKEEWCFLFIDEVSMLKEWQRAIKLLFDAGKFKDCTVLLTGSHSIDLRKGSESLAGRRGQIEKLRYGTPDKVLLPAKFSEYVETLQPSLASKIRELFLLSIDRRKQTFFDLANGRIPSELKKLAIFSEDLSRLLEDYLVTGGIASASHEYVSTGKISRDTYATFVHFVVRDLCNWGQDESYARQILRRLIETLASHVSWNVLKEDTEISDHKTAEAYVVVSYHYRLNINKTSADYNKEKKAYFQDPFIFHACRSWVYGKDGFEESQEFLSKTENRSRLVECVVGNHISRFMFNLHPSSLYDPSNFVFYWTNKNKEVDFVIRMSNQFLPIEVKYSDNIGKSDARGIEHFIKTGNSFPCGIITSKNRLEIGKNYVIVPLGIFLLLA
jgi:predicted AAA+ superfamily ATPase